MEKIIKTLICAALLACPVLPAALVPEMELSAAAKPAKNLQTVVYKTHLHCENCVKKVVENVSYVKGVVDLKVSLESQTIAVTYDANKTDAVKIAKEITDLGYPAIIENKKQ